MKKNIFMTILVCITAVSMLFGILYHITGTIRPREREAKAVQIEEKKDSGIRLVEDSSEAASKSEAASAEKETDKAASAEKETDKTDSESEKSGIRVLDIDLDLGDLNIVTGGEVNVEYSGNEKFRPVVSIDNGTLKIYQNPERNWFNLKSIKAKIIVTLPDDTELERLEIKESLGDIELQGMDALYGSVNNDLGDIKLRDCDIADLTIESSLGDVELEDTVFQKLSVKQDLGDVEIETPEDLSDATLDLQTDLGDVSVNGVKQGTAHSVTGTGDISVRVRNDLGDVRLNWNS